MPKNEAASKSAKSRVVRESTRSDRYAILNSLVGHIVVLNPHGTILFTNKAWNRFAKKNGNPPLRAAELGTNYLEIWKRAVSDGVPGAAAILSGIKGVLAGKRKRFSSEYPCDLPGEQRWFAMNVAPLEGTKGGVVTSHLDITYRRRAEMAVQKGGATIQALLDSGTQSIAAVDQAGKFVIVNASTEKMFGYSRDELLEQTLEILVPEAKRGRHANYHKTYFAEPQSRPMGIGLELEGRRKDGTVFPVEIGLSTVETLEGRLGVAFRDGYHGAKARGSASAPAGARSQNATGQFSRRGCALRSQSPLHLRKYSGRKSLRLSAGDNGWQDTTGIGDAASRA